MKALVPLTLSFLLLAGGAWAQDPKTYAAFPTGEGDPDAVTCRPPQTESATRLRGPEVCKTNAVWARYRRDGMDVAADGVHDVPLNRNGINCSVTPTTGGANWTGRMNMTCLDTAADMHNAPAPKPVICRAGTICG
jgi:hypothetical protein